MWYCSKLVCKLGMDLHSITTIVQSADFETIASWNATTAWLAGGTWLFSEPQPHLKTLVDLYPFHWTEIECSKHWLKIGAMCTLEQMQKYPWTQNNPSMKVVGSAISTIAASFKVTHRATIGGNICLALAVGVIAPTMVLLDATYELWSADRPPRFVAAKDFQTGIRETALEPGEVLRRVLIPAQFLKWRTTVKNVSVAATDPSISLVCAAFEPTSSALRISLGACVAAPLILQFAQLPSPQQVTDALASIDWLNDIRASAGYRKQVTNVLIHRAIAAVSSNVSDSF